MTITLTTAEPARHPSPTVKARALSYLIFDRADLDLTSKFLVDFGLHVADRRPDALFMRGSAAAPFCYVAVQAKRSAFRGLGLAVKSRADLEALTAIGGASGIEPIAWPGGGEMVRLIDPSGFEVHAVFGAAPALPIAHRAPTVFNQAEERPRVDATQRFPLVPPQVLRLGHLVLELAAFQATAGWYTRHFGFIPSDVQLLDDGSPAVAFMRLDLGDEPADHHTLALAQGIAATYSHSAYEVVDADAIGVGQRMLRESGWRHAWGIGRHVLGSQLFDYWYDPFGDKHEHYTDGDVFTAAKPTGYHALSRDGMAQWGEKMPKSFVKPKITGKLVVSAIRNLVGNTDVTVAKLRQLAGLLK
ncbi:hypothetical protein [Sphingomonas sp. GB1N7]|uniref:hypothetical protein n=1 Tax=Parasphingomonas caseinilytica TaxID=3096158 RepID=UPI002FC5B2E7